jgi:hypothetical protein
MSKPKRGPTPFPWNQLLTALSLLAVGLVLSTLALTFTWAPGADWSLWAFFWILSPLAAIIGAIWAASIAWSSLRTKSLNSRANRKP